MTENLILPAGMRDRILKAARLAFPRECCGLIEGVRDGNIVRALADHATRNIAEEPDRFEIDPAQHIAILKRLRGGNTEIVGCYHSHPNGKPEPSERDRDSAFGEIFLWLIAAVVPHESEFDAALRVFQICAGGAREVPIRLESSRAA